jgi:hypothetical protein
VNIDDFTTILAREKNKSQEERGNGKGEIQGPKSPLSLLPQPLNQEATKIKNKQKKIEGKKRIRCENGR